MSLSLWGKCPGMNEDVTCFIPTPENAEAIARLHVASWREAYCGIVPDEVLDGVDMAERVSSWRRYLGFKGYPTFLALAGGEAAGFIRAGRLAEPLVEGADGHIYALYVLARHHRRGIGRRLMGLVAAAWVEQGGCSMSVGVLTANAPARAFYEALGGRFVTFDVYEWDGHALDESIYLFENLQELARLA